MDHDTLPSNLNELIIKNYISMEAPPFDDNTWTYSLHLPEKIVSKPTFLNLVPGRDPLLFDWNSRTFQVDPGRILCIVYRLLIGNMYSRLMKYLNYILQILT